MASDQSNGPPRTDVEKALLGHATYRGISEQKLTPAEERFEKGRRTTGLWLAPLLTAAFLLAPVNLPTGQHQLAAILIGVITLWVTEAVPIPVGGLIGVSAIVLFNVVPAEEALAPFGSSTLFTFIGAFIIAQSMLQSGLARRFAFRILSLPGVGRSTVSVIIAFGVITCLLSAFVSNTATVAMLLPTALGILAVIAKLMQDRGEVSPDFDPTRLRVGTALVLMLAYGASVGGLLTPIGSPPNLIGRGFIEAETQQNISFFDWMVMAFPICVGMFVVLAIILLLLNKPEIRKLTGVEEHIRAERESLGKLSRREKNTIIAFVITVTLWIVPGVLAASIFGSDSSQYEAVTGRFDEGIVAVIGASILFLLPTDWKRREFTMQWSDAAKIDWGTILLFGTGMIFGALLESTELAQTLGNAASNALGLTSVVGITAFAVILAILVSETTSNTAAAAVVVPIIIPIAAAADVNVLIPALAATFGASFGFMLPVSTPQNAIAYGSGVVPITRMIRSGFGFDIIGALLIMFILPLMIAAVGFS